MNIDSNWVGIKDCIDNPLMSLDKYGFATSFSHEDLYDCILPDEDKEGCFIYRQISFNDVKKIIDSHPEIPIKETEKKKANIGYLLYMIDLYCDIYDLIDLSGDTSFHRSFIKMGKDRFESLDDDTKLKKTRKKKKRISRQEVINAIHTINEFGPLVFRKPYSISIPNYRLAIKEDPVNLGYTNCCDMLRSYGLSIFDLKDKIEIDENGDVWLRLKKNYILLE